MSFESFEKDRRFAELVESVQHCNLCPRLCSQRKVLSLENGFLESRVLFIAEAPGRLGADRTGIPLHGDRTGDNFEALLKNIGWRREDLFITNAVLCNPRQENGNNSPPTKEEIASCSSYLEMVLALVEPEVIVTLGVAALASLASLTPHGMELRTGVAKFFPWRTTQVFPLYHPGPRAMIHRSLSKQRSDFMLLAKNVDPIRGLRKRPPKKQEQPRLFGYRTSSVHQVARALLELGGPMTYFKLMKLMYFVDLFSIQKTGRMAACNLYLRQVDGPWSPELKDALREMKGYEVREWSERKIPMVAIGPAPRSKLFLDETAMMLVSEIVTRYGSLDNTRIKSAAYQTQPMRFILRAEQQGQNMSNKPVLYKGKTASELENTASTSLSCSPPDCSHP